MTQITILLDDTVAKFYEEVATQAQLPLEKVLADALYQLAGQLAMQALQNIC